jgi:arsenate reductase
MPDDSHPPKTVLFLCTGNSCRSQMAEAITNHDQAGRWLAFSAGTRPAGYVHPLALRALAEIGIAHQGESKSTEAFRGREFDLVVTVCDDAAENCPLWLGKGRKTHLGFPDPALDASRRGSEEERLQVFRGVRDDIRRRVAELLAG